MSCDHPDVETLRASGQPVDSRANNQKLRRWMLVINNPTFKESEDIYTLAHDPHVAGLMWSAEHAHDAKENEVANQTEHYHIYISLTQPQRFSWFKSRFPRAHIEAAHKPALACCRYVAKDGFYMAFGNVPSITKGPSRSVKQKADDLAREEVVKMIMRGELRMADLTAEQLLDNKLIRACERAASMIQGPERDDLYVCCFVSPTGWGKSYSIWKTFKRVASVEFGSSQEWFLDAEQETMLFDEFCGQVRAQKMLKYLDTYPISLPIKGGHRPCYWKLIFICSNTPPDEWYMKDDPKTGIRVSSIPDEVRRALYRRIGYPNASERGETHVYNETFTNLEAARAEMKQVCEKLHEKLYPKGEPEQMQDEDAYANRRAMECVINDMRDEQNQIRELAERHGINIEEEEARWDRAREIQRQRDEHEFDDLPDLEYDPPSSQDPNDSVPQVDAMQHEDEEDTCPDPPSDDSDFEN